MKHIDPVANARAVITGQNNPKVEELAEFWGASHDRLESAHQPANDSKLSYSGGNPVVINEREDERQYPDNVVSINGDHIAATEPSTFGNPVTPVPFDGFGAEGSGVDNITGKR